MKPVAPKSHWPLVSVGDDAQKPVIVTSPFDIPEPAENPYNDFLIACQVQRLPANADYLSGFVTGMSIVTGGMALDTAAGKAAILLLSAAEPKGKANFGQGATDAWRLFAEGKSFEEVRDGQ